VADYVSLLHATPRLSSYDATALVMIKPLKHQRLEEPMLQSGVITCKKTWIVVL